MYLAAQGLHCYPQAVSCCGGCSLVAVCGGFSLWWLLVLRSTGSRARAQWLTVVHRRSCPVVCGMSPGAAAAESLQSCPTLCDPIDGSPPGSPVLGILQARTLEWVAISFSNAWKWKLKVKSLSHVRLLVTSWTAAYQAPPSMGFSRQEYWSGVPLPSPWHSISGNNK